MNGALDVPLGINYLKSMEALYARRTAGLYLREERDGVRSIACDASWDRLDPFPFIIRGANLETENKNISMRMSYTSSRNIRGDALREQQG